MSFSQSEIDARWMQQALQQAELADTRDGEVPVGAVIVGADGDVIGFGSNRVISDNDPTAHAEIVALRTAGQYARNYRLPGATLYVTLEPCIQCCGAILLARIPRLVYGCDDPKSGAVRSLYSLLDDPRLNHRVDVRTGVREDECSEILSRFFDRIREKKRI